MEKLNLLIVLGTGRTERMSEHAARTVMDYAATRNDITPEFVDVRDWATPFTQPDWEETEMVLAWKKKVEKADGFIFVVPEYNHGYPGEFKILLDKAQKEYNKKPAGVVGVSSGGLGGARMVEQLMPIFSTLQIVPSKFSVYFSMVEELYKTGALNEEQQKSYNERLTKLFDDVTWYARALKTAREA